MKQFEFIDKTICRYDVFNNEEIRKRLLDIKNKKKGNIRYITEVNRDNIVFCKRFTMFLKILMVWNKQR